MASAALAAAEELASEGLFDLEVINARFAKPLDTDTLFRPLREGKFLLTVEEGILAGGFGSAVLEAACDAGIDPLGSNFPGIVHIFEYRFHKLLIRLGKLRLHLLDPVAWSVLLPLGDDSRGRLRS